MRNPAMGMGGGLKKALPPSGVVATLGAEIGGSQIITLTWTRPDQSTYDSFEIAVSQDGGAYGVGTSVSKLDTSFAAVYPYSCDFALRIRAVRNAGDPSDWVVSNTVRTVAATPGINSITASNPGALTLNAEPPYDPFSKVAGYDVQLTTNSGGAWGATVDTGADPDHVFTGITHGSNSGVRVRVRDTLGQVGAWATSTFVVVPNDTVGPVVPVPTMVWGPGSAFSVSWTAVTDATSGMTSDLAQVVLQISVNGGAAATVATYNLSNTATPGAARTVVDAIPSGDRGALIKYRLVCRDAQGNSTTGAYSTADYSKPLGTFYVATTDSGGYNTTSGAWRTDNNDLYSGNLSGDVYQGAWFYGTGIATIAKGYTPDSASLLFIRDGASGFSGVNNFQGITNTSQPAGNTTAVGSSDTGPTLTGADAQVDYTLPAGMRTNIGNGTLKSFKTLDSGSFRRLAGRSKNVYTGLLTLTYT